MRDATTNQDKRFGKIVARDNGHIAVEICVITSLCTIDTLTLQVTSVDVPYNMLARLLAKTFPVWPEVADTLPDSLMDFLVWPNPTTGSVTIQTAIGWGESLKLTVYNALGQRLLERQISIGISELNLFAVGSKVLFLRLRDANGGSEQVCRLLVQK